MTAERQERALSPPGDGGGGRGDTLNRQPTSHATTKRLDIGSVARSDDRNRDAALFDVEEGPYGRRVIDSPEVPAKTAVLAQVNAETDEFWRRTCDGGIRELARRGQPFEAYDLVELGVPEPPNSAQWGARLHYAARRGIIEAVGAGPSKRPTVRGSLVRYWRGLSPS